MLGWPPHDARAPCVSCRLKASHGIGGYRFSGGQICHSNSAQQMSKKRKSPDDQDFEESPLAGCSDQDINTEARRGGAETGGIEIHIRPTKHFLFSPLGV
ncbi:hypothetical protein Q5P01_021320 [Channa striata]|uniref:Uncharacterized protein n=1 Tax=Channa striata TaxID=64152 RepID=A0AA88LU31_CHASR|nr:hypothetical protein Q5P01_021320 [Channa striata]